MADLDFLLTTSGKHKLALRTAYREKELAKRVPGARWDNDDKVWVYPVSYTVGYQLGKVFGADLNVSDEVREHMTSEWQARTDRWNLQTDESVQRDIPHWGKLADKQRSAVTWLAASPGAILADEMGSGKTVMASMALRLVDAKRVIIVCPNSVKRNWESHLEEWTNIRPVVVKGNKTQRAALFDTEYDEPVAFILNWQQLVAHSRLKGYGNIRLSDKERERKQLNAETWDVVVADEAHRMKNPKAKQTRALWAIDANQRWLMTGTPIANHPGDMWSLLHYASPTDWPSRVAYIDRYCVQQWNPWGGSDIVGLRHDTRDEFYALTDPMFLRRQKHEIMGRKIGKNRHVRYVQLSPKHRKQYNEFRDELIARIEGGYLLATNPLAATTRLVQLSGAMLTYDDVEDTFSMVKPSPKVDELMQLLEDLGDEPLVVYSSSKKLLWLAEAALDKAKITCRMVTGDVNVDDRHRYVQQFQDGHYRVFLATSGASAEGIDLFRSKHLCMLQRSWSMVENVQAEDRIHRWGQEADEVEYYDIIAEDTIDERVHMVYSDKQSRLQEITRDDLINLI